MLYTSNPLVTITESEQQRAWTNGESPLHGSHASKPHATTTAATATTTASTTTAATTAIVDESFDFEKARRNKNELGSQTKIRSVSFSKFRICSIG